MMVAVDKSTKQEFRSERLISSNKRKRKMIKGEDNEESDTHISKPKLTAQQ